MECPVCKNIFQKFKEILMLIERSFYCHHCWNRLISYPDGEGECRIEVDPLGEKWKKIERTSPVFGSDEIGRAINSSEDTTDSAS